MHDLAKLFNFDENLCENCSYSTLKWFLLFFPLGNVLFGGELQIDAINSNFEIFESALYMKSGRMHLKEPSLKILVSQESSLDIFSHILWWILKLKSGSMPSM